MSEAARGFPWSIYAVTPDEALEVLENALAKCPPRSTILVEEDFGNRLANSTSLKDWKLRNECTVEGLPKNMEIQGHSVVVVADGAISSPFEIYRKLSQD